LIYREGVSGDIEKLAQLHYMLVYELQCKIKDDYWDFETFSESLSQEFIRLFTGSPERRIYAAIDGEEFVGFIAAEPVACHLPISSVKKVGYISGAYVLPQYRGKGVMKRLEALASGFFKSLGLNYAELNFLSGNADAKNAWESLGYKTFRQQARKKLD
jgi:ribosomal protein S18 acetylase RimI-like enzyme